MNVYVNNSELQNAYIGEYGWKTVYQEVEYIQSNATNPGATNSTGQYIQTNVVASKDIKVEIDLQFTDLSVQQRLFGIGGDTGSSNVTFEAYINGSQQWARATANGQGNWQTTNISANTNRNKFVLQNSNYVIYNASGSQVYSASNSSTISNTTSLTIPLLARYWWSTPGYCFHSSAKLYSCKMRNNNVLVRDYVPCYRRSDNVIGLYDKVNDVFYTNAGTGNFTKGADVN